MKKIFLGLSIALLLIVPAEVFAASYVNDGGITIDGVKAKYFTDYDLTSTEFVYNEAGGTSSTSGWVAVRAAKTRTINYFIEDVTGTTTISFEGTIMGTGKSTKIIDDLEVGTTTSGFIPVTEDLDEIRIGGKVETGGAKITIWGKYPGI